MLRKITMEKHLLQTSRISSATPRNFYPKRKKELFVKKEEFKSLKIGVPILSREKVIINGEHIGDNFVLEVRSTKPDKWQKNHFLMEYDTTKDINWNLARSYYLDFKSSEKLKDRTLHNIWFDKKEGASYIRFIMHLEEFGLKTAYLGKGCHLIYKDKLKGNYVYGIFTDSKKEMVHHHLKDKKFYPKLVAKMPRHIHLLFHTEYGVSPQKFMGRTKFMQFTNSLLEGMYDKYIDREKDLLWIEEDLWKNM